MKRHLRHDTLLSRILMPALAVALLVTAPPASAEEDAGAPGAFLRFGTSARGIALGNAVTGVADDLASSSINPAGLAGLRTMELTAMGATLFEDTQYSFVSLGLPTESYGTFALSGTFLSSGEFERASLYDDLGETFSETEGAFALSYARGGNRWSWGVTLKSVSHTIAGASGHGMGADLGLYLRPHRTLSFGFAVQNVLAPEITLDQEPEKLARSIRGGTALRFFNDRFVAMADIVKTELMDPSFRSGLEVWPSRAMSLRGGYDAVSEQMSAGAGFRWENWQFDYTYLNHDLGGTNILSATLRFGVPYGVKVHRDKSLFSPSGSDRKVSFDIDTAVRGSVDSWELVITDQEGKVVRTVNGNGSPPEAFSWEGKDDDGRLVGDGSYEAKVVILDDVGQEWDYQTSVKVLGFRDRTRVPIRVEVSGSGKDQNKGKDR